MLRMWPARTHTVSLSSLCGKSGGRTNQPPRLVEAPTRIRTHSKQQQRWESQFEPLCTGLQWLLRITTWTGSRRNNKLHPGDDTTFIGPPTADDAVQWTARPRRASIEAEVGQCSLRCQIFDSVGQDYREEDWVKSSKKM